MELFYPLLANVSDIIFSAGIVSMALAEMLLQSATGPRDSFFSRVRDFQRAQPQSVKLSHSPKLYSFLNSITDPEFPVGDFPQQRHRRGQLLRAELVP